MLDEIGSNFWLDPNIRFQEKSLGSPNQFNCYGSDFVWLSTGRSAISLVIQTIETYNPGLKKVAVLPSFTCDTVFEPFLNAGYEVCFYPINNDLTTNSNEILRIALERDASIILFHRYFGFDSLDSQICRMCEVLRAEGKYSIEDCTQCLYSNIPRADADFSVGSIRKWTGTPDGGFAVCRGGEIRRKPSCRDEALEQAKIKAFYAKYRYLFEKDGNKDEILIMFREAEDILEHQNRLYAISEMSAKVQSNLDRMHLVQNRQDNYRFLEETLAGIVEPVFSLESGLEVPLYFPILVKERALLQKHLIDNNIYAPIVWPRSERLPKQCDGAENAYQHLLCIPIDQRYDKEDMKRVVNVIKEFFIK